MLDIKMMMKGLIYLQTVGVEQKEDWEVAAWLSIVNEDGNYIEESEKVKVTPEEFENACKYLAAKQKKFYPGDNVPAFILDRVQERRREIRSAAFKRRQEQKSLEEKKYREGFEKRFLIEKQRSGSGKLEKMDFKGLADEIPA